MKTYIPTIGLIASLAFASANSFAQDSTTPAPEPLTPAPPKVPRGVAVPAAPEAEVETAAADSLAAHEDALRAQEDALRAQEDAFENVNKSLTLIGGHSGHATSTRSLIIPKDPQPDAKNITETEEDMSVMARILEKAVSSKRQKSQRSASVSIWSSSGFSANPRNLYIDGFGALFFVDVNYPLLPTAAKEETTDSKNESDSEWKRTRDELYSSQGPSPSLSFNFTPFDSGSYIYTSGPAEEYDENKVTELKENLTAALKNAGHIRRLKGDETVTVIVTGRSPGSSAKVTARRSQNGSSSSSSSSSWSTSSRPGSQAPPARLLIRAKRSDIESFQKDKLSADDFRKKVTMFIY